VEADTASEMPYNLCITKTVDNVQHNLIITDHCHKPLEGYNLAYYVSVGRVNFGMSVCFDIGDIHVDIKLFN
jgi:hypothetical protein